MTDNEIIKALECCFLSECACKDCSYSDFEICDTAKMINTVIDLINRQKEEIERYKGVIILLEKDVANAKPEAIKEFAERLKKMISPNKNDSKE